MLRCRPWILGLLSELGSLSEFSEDQFDAALNKWSVNELNITPQQFLAELSEMGVVWPCAQRESLQAINREISLDWESNGWASAKLFHDSVVYSKFLQADPDGWKQQLEAMECIQQSGEGPAPFRELDQSLPRLRLADNPRPLESPLAEVLLKRRTKRMFASNRPITQEVLSSILFYSAKAQHQYHNKFFGTEIRRTSPSGGSRHPVELYPQLFGPAPEMCGNFYYNPLQHELVRLGPTGAELMNVVSQRQIKLEQNFVVFLVTARFCRNFWKYRYAKSYLFTLFDVGHLVQTLIFTCEAHGLGCFLTPALDVEAVQRHLQLQNIYDECPVYFLAAGFSNSGVDA